MFQPGQRIIMSPKADNYYTITAAGTEWTVYLHDEKRKRVFIGDKPPEGFDFQREDVLSLAEDYEPFLYFGPNESGPKTYIYSVAEEHCMVIASTNSGFQHLLSAEYPEDEPPQKKTKKTRRVVDPFPWMA